MKMKRKEFITLGKFLMKLKDLHIDPIAAHAIAQNIAILQLKSNDWNSETNRLLDKAGFTNEQKHLVSQYEVELMQYTEQCNKENVQPDNEQIAMIQQKHGEIVVKHQKEIVRIITETNQVSEELSLVKIKAKHLGGLTPEQITWLFPIIKKSIL